MNTGIGYIGDENLNEEAVALINRLLWIMRCPWLSRDSTTKRK